MSSGLSVKATQGRTEYFTPAEGPPAEESVDALADELGIVANPSEVRAELDKDRSVDELARELEISKWALKAKAADQPQADIPALSLGASAIRTKTRALGADGKVPTVLDLLLTDRTHASRDKEDREKAEKQASEGAGRTTVADKVQRSFSGAKKASSRTVQATGGTPKAAHQVRKPMQLKSSLSDASQAL